MASKFQRGYDDERFETIVNRNFHCFICLNVLRDPVMCRRNQHYFCRGCIKEHLCRNSHTCPTCADELSVETLCDVPRIVMDYLDELNIRCDYYDRGCRELVQLQKLERHVAECGFTPVVCGNQGCGSTISRRDRTYHESELCEFRKVKCHNCEEISTKMTAMDTKIKNIETKTGNAEGNLVDINRKMAFMEERIENSDTEIANMKTKLGTIDTGMTNFEANMDAKFEAVNNEVREIKMRLTEVIARGTDQPIASGDKEKQHIFVASGVRTNSVELFNYRRRLWSLLKPMPELHWRASSYVYNGQVTVAGGVRSGDFVNSMIQMNIQPVPDLTTTWSDFAAKLPAKMFGHSSVVYRDSLFVTGGMNCDQQLLFSDCINEVQLQPPYTVKLLSKMPEPRIYHSTILCDESILIFGGTSTGGYKHNLSSVLSYDLKKNKCQQLPQLPFPVSEVATVKWSENVVIIGGADKDGKTLNKVIIYNIKTGNSHMLPHMLQKRKGCMAVVIQNTIVVLGGEDETGKSLKTVEGFSFDRYTWEELPDMKKARSFATAVVI